MTHRIIIATAFLIGLIAADAANDNCHARGFGGGRGGGGGMRGGMGGMGGGGFSGGGMGGAGMRGGGFSGAPNFGGGGFGGAGMGGGGFGGAGMSGAGPRSFGGLPGGGGAAPNFPGFGAGGLPSGGLPNRGLAGGAGPNFAGRGGAADAFNPGSFNRGNLSGATAPNPSQLNSFLGLPSDEGLHSAASAPRFDPSDFDVNTGSIDGPRGGQAAGYTVSGPRGNEVAGGAAVGPLGGVAAGRAVQGAGGAEAQRGVVEGPRGGVAAGGSITGPQGGTAARGVAVGPEGGVAAGRGVVGPGGAGFAQGGVVGPGGRAAGGAVARGPEGGAAARGFVAGPRGYAAGFARITPSDRYFAAGVVRGNFHDYGIYGHGWYAAHPGAWYAAGWAAGSAWTAATWDSLGAWFGYAAMPPVYYDYGSTVVTNGDNVYIDGQDAGSTADYTAQATALATAGAEAQAAPEEQWMPLGVFALTKADDQKSTVLLQLAVNKQRIIRGNETDTVTNKTKPIEGSVDVATQRVAFIVGDNKDTVVETGLYNLTKDEAPALIHFGSDRTEQWLLVRLKQQPDADAAVATP